MPPRRGGRRTQCQRAGTAVSGSAAASSTPTQAAGSVRTSAALAISVAGLGCIPACRLLRAGTILGPSGNWQRKTSVGDFFCVWWYRSSCDGEEHMSSPKFLIHSCRKMMHLLLFIYLLLIPR